MLRNSVNPKLFLAARLGRVSTRAGFSEQPVLPPKAKSQWQNPA